MSRSVVDTNARTGTVALPNVLSLLRIALVPVVVGLLMWPSPATRLAAAMVFLAAAITDFLDGWVARRRGLTTALGKFLDPLADKLLVVAVLIMLAAMPPDERIPAWMAVVIALRELAVTGLRAVASHGGVVMAARDLGKYKMLLQIFALEALLVHHPYAVPGTALTVDFHACGMVFLWMAIVLAVWSAIDYYVRIVPRVVLD